MTPAEETMHVLLRPYTEKAIEDKIVLLSKQNIKTVKTIVDDRVAVEEAVAGSLVYTLLPQFFDRYLPDFPSALIKADHEAKMKREKYRYLQCGIDLIEKMGFKAFLNLYKADPDALRQLLKDYQSL